MCGIVGAVGKRDVNQALYDALLVLQHRGQDAAGIMCSDHRGRLSLRKSNGLVNEVFTQRDMSGLVGSMGLGHCRYPTAGCASSSEAQPFYVNSPYGISLAHNGNLTNSRDLARDLFESDLRHINTSSDSEVLLNVFAHELQALGKYRPSPDDIFDAVRGVHQRCRGAYAFVAMITGHGLVGVRDPHGIRPLCIGQRASHLYGTEYMIASESVALATQGYKLLRDVGPGEAVFVDATGVLHSRRCTEARHTPCIFEYVYLARPDSVIDGVSVYNARLRMGEKLAGKIQRQRPDHGIDVVIPIPDSGRTAALQLANTLGVPYREGFIKNRYIGRTFIMPGQAQRADSVRKKLNPIDSEFVGKTVCLVDDSLVRGTTSRQIIQMARDAGAARVYFASAAPKVTYPNVYGIDMPAATELIGHGRTDQQVAQQIGADWLIYQDLPDLIEACRPPDDPTRMFDTSIFDGQYITGDVDASYLTQLEAARADAARRDDVPVLDDPVLSRGG
jgi:amidophosphoribosyltransferase